MSSKYSVLSSDEPESVKIDFGSPFDYSSGIDFGGKKTFDYRTAFTYKSNRNFVVESEYKESTWAYVLSLVFIGLCHLLILLTFPVSAWFCFKVVKQNDRLVVFRLGKLKKPAKGPGTVFIIPFIDKLVKVDITTRAFSVPPQKVFTKDGAVIEIGADVHYMVHDATLSVLSTQNLNQSTRVAAQTTLLNYLGKLKLPEIEVGRTSINLDLQSAICRQTTIWGIKITRVEISQVKVLQTECPLISGPPGGMSAITHVLQQLFPGMMPQAEENSPTQMVSAFTTGGSTSKTSGDSQVLVDIESRSQNTTAGMLSVAPRQLIEAIRLLINDNLVRNVDAVYQFDIQGDGGGIFNLNLKYGHGSAGEGPPTCSTPDSIISISVVDMQRLFTGELKPMQAYISGLLRVSGDLSAAMRLEHVINQITS